MHEKGSLSWAANQSMNTGAVMEQSAPVQADMKRAVWLAHVRLRKEATQ